MLRLLMYVSFSGLTLKQFFDIIQGEVRKNRSLKEHSGFATTAIHATRSASLRRFYLLTEKSQTCGLVNVFFQSLLMTLNLIRPSSIGVWVELKPLFEEKQPWQLPVSSDSVQLTDSLVSGEMKLILFTICFSIKQRRTRRRGRLRIVVLKIRTLALSLLARTSDSDSEEVGAVPTEPAIALQFISRTSHFGCEGLGAVPRRAAIDLHRRLVQRLENMWLITARWNIIGFEFPHRLPTLINIAEGRNGFLACFIGKRHSVRL